MVGIRLTQALRLDCFAHLALVGAGGKTAVLFTLAREFLQPVAGDKLQPRYLGIPVNPRPLAGSESPPARTVLLTATTHLATEQVTLADRYFVMNSETEIDELVEDLPTGVLLFTGSPGDDGRTAGLPEGPMDQLRDLAVRYSLPLLVEADGSRRFPLKAPADHEPAIPAWITTVVVVAGLSGLGKSLTRQWVHRPDIFSRLANLDQGKQVTPEALLQVLCHPQGGLKGIPPLARRVALLNQASTVELQSTAQRLSRPLLAAYSSVVVADLPPPDLVSGEERQNRVIAVHERIAGVVLAAGGAQRMGQPKQLLSWRDQPLVRHVAQTALEAGLDPVIVVTGSVADQVEAAVSDLPVQVVNNPAWEDGQSSSVKAGLWALPEETGAAVFLLADQPRTPATLIASLIEAHAATLSPLVAPLIQGQRANPVLMDRVTFPDLLLLNGDQGGRALFARYPVQWVPWHDFSILQDIDTPEDYWRLLET